MAVAFAPASAAARPVTSTPAGGFTGAGVPMLSTFVCPALSTFGFVGGSAVIDRVFIFGTTWSLLDERVGAAGDCCALLSGLFAIMGT